MTPLPNPETNRDQARLNELLRGSKWTTTEAAVKAAALSTFRRHHRRRRILRGSGATLLALITLVGLQRLLPGLREHAASPGVAVSSLAQVPKPPKTAAAPPGSSRFLRDEELIALFPPDTCVLAEVGGQKRLVFLDPALEQKFFSR